MSNNNFSSWPDYSEDEAQAISKVLLSNKVNYWTGKKCRDFEKSFAKWSGARYAVSLANGTLALDAALKAIDLETQDEVIVTSRTFIASVSSIVNAGAVPIFADVDANSQNITHESILKKITNKTKAIICVHLAGWPCEMDDIMELASKHNLIVIEDCAQAHGALYKGRSVGSIGHIGCWSFCQDKIMTTGGEGGMITTNIESFWKKIWSLKDHGKNFDLTLEVHSSNSFRWIHDSFGSNWRMTEIQATIGLIQLGRMQEWSERRLNNAKTIWSVSREFSGLRVPEIPKFISHGAYRCYVFVNSDNLNPGWNRDKIIEQINDRGVNCSSGSCSEVYLEKAFTKTSFRPKKRLRVAKDLGETSIAFLVHPNLTKTELKKTCNVITEVMKKASLNNTV